MDVSNNVMILGVHWYLVSSYFISSSHEYDQGPWNCYEHVNECNIDKCQDLIIGHFIFGHNIVVFSHGFMVVGQALVSLTSTLRSLDF